MFYRLIMKLSHKFNWHYAPPVYPDGDTKLWCKWCGFKEIINRRPRTIKDLQDILDSNEEYEVTINRDGSIHSELVIK